MAPATHVVVSFIAHGGLHCGALTSFAPPVPMQSDHRLRAAAYHLVTLASFDYLLILVVLLSCVEVG